MTKTKTISYCSACTFGFLFGAVAALLVLGAGGCGGMDSTSAGVANYPPAPPVSPGPTAGSYQDGEKYTNYGENEFIDPADDPLSTFSIDVDTASYTIGRRDLNNGRLPVPDSVRVEEYVNYFVYDYPQPQGDAPFSINLEMAPSRFGKDLQLLRVGIKGREVPEAQRKDANLVFLIDVSGSMAASNKLGLVKYALNQLVAKLQPTDTLAIAVYASADGVVLPPTPVKDKATILASLDQLQAGGSTNGEAGIRTAYRLADKAFRQDGINRVVLCTDGDFNVGLTGDALVALIESYRKKGVSLSALGFGMGNYNDSTMEMLADKGNGNYAYIDSQGEANRVLGEHLVGTLQIIAKDVKLQLELDDQVVARYRLIGYENRVLDHQDFTDDDKDAGDIGAGHDVTALYELELSPNAAGKGTVATVRIRYKDPEGSTSKELTHGLSLDRAHASFGAASTDFRFAAAVAELAEILRQSKHSEGTRLDEVATIADATKGGHADRAELVGLIEAAASLCK